MKRENEVVLADVTKNARETIRASSRAVAKIVDEAISDLEHKKNVFGENDEISSLREELVDKIEVVFLSEKERLKKLKLQLSAMEEFWHEDGYGSFELAEALKEELEAQRDTRDADLALAQIGLAINTISHEFEKSVGGLRNGLRRLGSWANANPKLRELYSEMRVSFEHLDSEKRQYSENRG